MLIFRRVQYRVFPNNQVVALYYSNMVNKYLSIPFGADGNLNLSESSVLDEEQLNELGGPAGAVAGAALSAGGEVVYRLHQLHFEAGTHVVSGKCHF